MTRPLQTCAKCGKRTKHITHVVTEPQTNLPVYTYKCVCGLTFVVKLGIPPRRPKPD